MKKLKDYIGNYYIKFNNDNEYNKLVPLLNKLNRSNSPWRLAGKDYPVCSENFFYIDMKRDCFIYEEQLRDGFQIIEALKFLQSTDYYFY